MKRINGEYYEKVRFHGDRKYLVRVSREEVDERQLYWLSVVATPLVSILVLAAAAGMI